MRLQIYPPTQCYPEEPDSFESVDAQLQRMRHNGTFVYYVYASRIYHKYNLLHTRNPQVVLLRAIQLSFEWLPDTIKVYSEIDILDLQDFFRHHSKIPEVVTDEAMLLIVQGIPDLTLLAQLCPGGLLLIHLTEVLTSRETINFLFSVRERFEQIITHKPDLSSPLEPDNYIYCIGFKDGDTLASSYSTLQWSTHILRLQRYYTMQMRFHQQNALDLTRVLLEYGLETQDRSTYLQRILRRCHGDSNLQQICSNFIRAHHVFV